MGNDAKKTGVFRLVSKKAHRLYPSVSESLESGNDHFVAKPLVENVVEKFHASVQVKSTFSVHDLMPHNIGHCCHPWVLSKFVNFYDILN